MTCHGVTLHIGIEEFTDCGCGRSEPRKIIPSGAKYNHLTVIKIGHCEKGRDIGIGVNVTVRNIQS